jgi:putative hemolysin
VALRLARPFGWYVTAFRPLIVLLNGAGNALVRLVRVEPVDEHRLVHTPEELTLALAESRQLGTISAQDARVMDAALSLAEIDAEGAMTPRVDLAALADTASVREVLGLAAETGHTRIPIYHEDIDHIVGLVHVKDVLIRDDAELEALTVVDLLRPIPAVPESRDLEQLMRDMLDDRSHAVLVVDEFGGTAGLLTLEDVLEELVGEIADEFDREEPMIEPLAGGAVRVNARMPIDEVNDLLEAHLPEGDWDTIGGLMYHLLGHIPDEGESAEWNGHLLRAEQVKGRRIGRVRIEPDLEAMGPDAGRAGTP